MNRSTQAKLEKIKAITQQINDLEAQLCELLEGPKPGAVRENQHYEKPAKAIVLDLLKEGAALQIVDVVRELADRGVRMPKGTVSSCLHSLKMEGIVDSDPNRSWRIRDTQLHLNIHKSQTA
jgi:hypothetical protein